MSFQVTVEPSGRTFSVEPDETVLEAAIRAQVGLPYGCKSGACSSCKCQMTSGKVNQTPYQENVLSQAELDAGLILTCCAKPATDLVLHANIVSSADTFDIRKLPCRVTRMERCRDDVMIVHLQLPANDTLQYHAGQYIEFILKDGNRRSYSMANAPYTQVPNGVGIELHIRLMAGGLFTTHVFDGMKERDILRIEGPFGTFFLREDSDKPIIFLVSGTGFAPIKAILEHMQHQNISRPAHLYWGGRRPKDLYMLEWLEQQMALMPNLSFIPVISDALPQDQWSGRTGYVHQAVMADFPDLSAYQVYACGAPVMVESAQRDFSAQCGLPENEFYADAFTSAADHQQTVK
ncbi:CDP-6-deoxy-delta-3,4-glucoseen reductase [Saezia sanguinis]|uniref:CDP-6-deoxy-delta-3,4-glucoseen reductase n=1 Tax=Saezia sanguinis TaxID=1965230 RepID=UPI0030371017